MATPTHCGRPMEKRVRQGVTFYRCKCGVTETKR